MSIDRDWLQSIIDDDALGLLDIPATREAPTADDRLIEKFREIIAFVESNGRAPEANDKDIQEYMLHHRLVAILEDPGCWDVLSEFDTAGVLVEAQPPASLEEVFDQDSDGLLAAAEDDLFTLRNVPEAVDRPERVAQRKPCADFDTFKPLFAEVHADLKAGRRKSIPFSGENQISQGAFFVYGGLLTYVESMGEATRDKQGKLYVRIRCIVENGTEFEPLLRSLGRNLLRDEGRRITEPSDVTLQRMGLDPATKTGYVYVLRSLSTDPRVAAIPHLHKIGYTSGTTRERVSRANDERTYLRAPVEIVAEYAMPAAIAPKVETLLHHLFAPARVEVTYEEGGEVKAEAKEWFSAPLEVIDEAIELVNADALEGYEYDPAAASLRLRG